MIERTQGMSVFLHFLHEPAKGTFKPEWLCCDSCDMRDYMEVTLLTQTHKNTILKSTQETSLNSPTLLGSALQWLTPLTDQRRLFVPMSKAAQRHCSISGLLCSTLIFAASRPISFHAGAKLCAALWGRLLFLLSGMTLCSVMKGKVISMHITRCGILAKRQKTYPEM